MQVEIYFNPFNNEKNPFGSAAAIYEFVNCWPGPDGNQDNSWLRFLIFTNSLTKGRPGGGGERGGGVDSSTKFLGPRGPHGIPLSVSPLVSPQEKFGSHI